MRLKVWLDDCRPPPDETWTCTKLVDQVKLWLRTEIVEELSLDNDLGPNLPEGYTLVNWMAEHDTWPIRKPTVHSMNPVRRAYMREVIDRYFPSSEL